MTRLPEEIPILETLSFELAWKTYLDAKNIYPAPKKQSNNFVHIQSIYDTVEVFDTFVFDGYGVLNIGNQPVPEMPEFIRFLQNKGKKLFVLTNGATFDKSDNIKKFNKLGYRFLAEQLISSRDVYCECLLGKNNGNELYGVSATEASRLELIPLNFIEPADNAKDYDRCDQFMLLSSGQWNKQRHRLMCDSLLRKKRPVTVLNPDVTAPVGNIYTCEPGYYAYLIYCETGIIPEYYGKPFQNSYDILKKYIGYDTPMAENKTVMIGDTPQTDILGGMNAGFQTLLMADYGLLRNENYRLRFDECGIFPDYVLSSRCY